MNVSTQVFINAQTSKLGYFWFHNSLRQKKTCCNDTGQENKKPFFYCLHLCSFTFSLTHFVNAEMVQATRTSRPRSQSAAIHLILLALMLQTQMSLGQDDDNEDDNNDDENRSLRYVFPFYPRELDILIGHLQTEVSHSHQYVPCRKGMESMALRRSLHLVFRVNTIDAIRSHCLRPSNLISFCPGGSRVNTFDVIRSR